jgi:glycosyltransferase A (GT-A) superfamily protein (DUF2064 family)
VEYVAEAFDKLQEFPVVLGPTIDGGYYLFGVSQSVPPIFNNIPWSTPEVWPLTVSRLAAAQIPYHVLPEWYDVDDDQGLTALQANIDKEKVPDIHLRHLAIAMRTILQPRTLNLEP